MPEQFYATWSPNAFDVNPDGYRIGHKLKVTTLSERLDLCHIHIPEKINERVYTHTW